MLPYSLGMTPKSQTFAKLCEGHKSLHSGLSRSEEEAAFKLVGP